MTRNARSFLKYFSRASRRFALLRRRFKFRSVVSDGKKAGRAPRPVRGRAWNKDLRKSRGEHRNERERERERLNEEEGGLAVLHIPVGPPRLWSSPRHAELTSTRFDRWLALAEINVRRHLANCATPYMPRMRAIFRQNSRGSIPTSTVHWTTLILILPNKCLIIN